ncbi:tyrosine protein kinase [Christiangramia fulva]|uniref:non-specific protein-tyrosine kinase n=1 Tax=Christiangramia fulva TaxID=2126553 RepID=A0A2R3Z4T1_9FLAO|nr:tyrosine-protein kinase [Christiangramia fulva]AVR45286.1 tyrosine protein kinase [Christiangramia fulva]
MAQQQNKQNFAVMETLDIREELNKYLKYWPWFLLTILLFVSAAWLYLRYSTPIYKATSTILIKGGENPSSELAAFEEMGLMKGINSSSIQNEIALLKSKRLMTGVANALDLNIRYYHPGSVRNVELYDDTPLVVRVLAMEKVSGAFYAISETGKGQLNVANTETGETFKASLDKPVNLGFADVVISKNPETDSSERNSILVQFSGLEQTAEAYRKRLGVDLPDKNSSIVAMTMEDPVSEKAQDILNQLVLEYNQDAIEDKNLVARNTAQFIAERLKIINEELDSVETGKVQFKERNELVNIESQSEMFVENIHEINQQEEKLGTQLELTSALLAYLKSASQADLLPANLGVEEGNVNQQIERYNQLVLERNKILRGSTELNPVVQRLDSQITSLKGNILESLNRLKSNLQISLKDLRERSSSVSSRIASVPAKEKQFRSIERQQKIKEALFLLLLQKREENSLALAVTAPKAKIVDRAYSLGVVFPNSRSIYLGAFLAGLLIPFMIVYLKRLLNNKVEKREDLETAVKEIPIVGEIPKIQKKESDLIESNDRSVLAESFRILINNLQYLLVGKEEKETGVKIFVTSTVKGEGKTFTAFNLALTLANIEKKVLILGADLRNPQLQRYESGAKELLGVSDFLVREDIHLKDVIRDSALHRNLQLLASGSIPPNPSELWRRKRAAQMFGELEKMYDYIVVDTAPAMLVADTFLISKFADITLYLVRAGYTEKKLLNFAADAKEEGKLTDVAFVLNNVKMANFGYGNKYGYAYGEEKKSFLGRLKNKAAMW